MPPKGYRKPKPQGLGAPNSLNDSAMAAGRETGSGSRLERAMPSIPLPTRKRDRKGQPQRAAESALSRPRSPLVRKINRKPKNHFLAPVQDTKRVPKRNQVYEAYVVAIPSRPLREEKDGDGSKALNGRRSGSNGRSDDGDDDEYAREDLDEYEEAGDEAGEHNNGDEPEDYSDPSASDDEGGDKKSGLAAMAAGAAHGRKRKQRAGVVVSGTGAVENPSGQRSVDDLWEDCLVLIEELELRGELTEEEGALLRRLIDQRYGPLVNLFEGTTESRAHFVVGAKGLCAARR